MGNYLGAAATGRTRSVPVAMPLTHPIKRREALLPSGQAVPTPVGGDHCAVLARMEYRTEPNQSTAACLPVIVPGYGSESRGSRMITEPHRPATVRSM